MTRASTTQALGDLAEQLDRTPGWTIVRQRKGSGVTALGPDGQTVRFNISGQGGCKTANVRAQLKRAGWDPTAADRAKDRQAKRRLAEAQQKTENALERAQLEGERRAHVEQLTKARTALDRAEVELRRTRTAYENAERTHRQALTALRDLEEKATS
ncbi:hypothetical protein GCM10010302_26670 [Streptomyces polychromogenes]|uniref:Uncharacterized protein n=1 Tax=Streptomyces polychromogenes TaxID=67342 RepID=A0ABN0VC82_9ACTN